LAWALGGKPSHGVRVDNLVGEPIDAGVASVVFKVGTNMPAVHAGWRHGAQVVRWPGFWCMTTCVPRGAMG